MTDPFPQQGKGVAGSAGGSGNDLRESLLKARIARLPHLPAVAPFAPQGRRQLDEEGEEEEQDTLGSLSAMRPPRPQGVSQNQRRKMSEEFGPLSADDCFEEALEVDIRDTQSEAHRQSEIDSDVPLNEASKVTKGDTFRVYYTAPRRWHRPASSGQAPSPSLAKGLVDRSSDGAEGALDDDEDDDSAGTVFLLHHGAGYSALSFALVAKSITQQTNGRAGVLAFDSRGHGKTKHASIEDSRSLSLANLTQDGLAILAKMFPKGSKQPNLVLVGHSMGGAVVVSMAHALSSLATAGRPCPHVAGVAVLDVVEGTAMDALPSMKLIVSQLPRGFRSIPDAIRWHVESGTIVNAQSARRSVPSLLRLLDGHASEKSIENDEEEDSIEELSGTPDDTMHIPDSQTTYPYVWRHDLLSTEPYWSGWFSGLSQSFLQVKCARLLLLAGTDRLDKELMIGQMQGKYQLVVFPEVGHSLQEDAPQKTAQTLIDFWQRNESINIKAVKGLRKVGQD